MALLTPNDVILPAYIHVDRMAFQFSYGCPNGITAYAAKTVLKALVSNGRDLPGMGLSFTIDVQGVPMPVRVKFTKPSRTTPFYFKIYLSPLRLLRAPNTLEASKDGQINFLATGQLSADNSFIVRAVMDWLILIETALDDLAHRLSGQLSASSFSLLIEWRLHAIELCADLQTPDPGFVVGRAARAIRTHYRNDIRSTYQSAHHYQGMSGDSLMSWGFAQKGERIKAYEKTICRVRFECALDKHALNAILGDAKLSRKLSSWDSIEDIILKLAAHASTRFKPLTAAVSGLNHASSSPFALMGLAFQGQRSERTEAAFLALVRTHRITWGFYPELVKAWCGRGILTRVARGQYAIAPKFAAALNAVAPIADGWMQANPTVH